MSEQFDRAPRPELPEAYSNSKYADLWRALLALAPEQAIKLPYDGLMPSRLNALRSRARRVDMVLRSLMEPDHVLLWLEKIQPAWLEKMKGL